MVSKNVLKYLLSLLLLFSINSYAQSDSILSKKYLILPDILAFHTDMNTEKKISYIYGEIWSVDTIKNIESYGYTRLRVLLKNARKNIYAIDLSDFQQALNEHKILTSTQFYYYERKFGKVNMKTILEGIVTIGMTKEMVTVSWGEPDKINRTILASSTHEQWIYNDNYLYFDNNKLTAIQQF